VSAVVRESNWDHTFVCAAVVVNLSVQTVKAFQAYLEQNLRLVDEFGFSDFVKNVICNRG
jgi:hypothetical protein